MNNLLRQLPKVDEMLQNPGVHSLFSQYSYTLVVESIRAAIDQVRQEILAGSEIDNVPEKVYIYFNKIVKDTDKTSLKRVLNGTGIVLHTNLGRARLAKAAMKQVAEIASSYSTLEYNLAERQRGSRYDHVISLLKRVTGAEDALVVNNNAAAVLLALNTMAKGQEALVSRGQLIEIGGSFRIPAVMEQSGCHLHEVGATNKTHLYDYENGINEKTALMLKVHTSNYRILGFAQEVSTPELVELGLKYNIPVLEDLGSGMLYNTSRFGLTYEPTVAEVISAGVDVVTFSGDKLLGGPQAGIIVGKQRYIEAMKHNHLNRALRIDKLTLAALEATLKLYLDEETALREIPTLRMLSETVEELSTRASRLQDKLQSILNNNAVVEIVDTYGQVGGGALPLEQVPSKGIAISPLNTSVNDFEESLRLAPLPLIARIENDSLLIDLRTIAEDEEQDMLEAIAQVLREENK